MLTTWYCTVISSKFVPFGLSMGMDGKMAQISDGPHICELEKRFGPSDFITACTRKVMSGRPIMMSDLMGAEPYSVHRLGACTDDLPETDVHADTTLLMQRDDGSVQRVIIGDEMKLSPPADPYDVDPVMALENDELLLQCLPEDAAALRAALDFIARAELRLQDEPSLTAEDVDTSAPFELGSKEWCFYVMMRHHRAKALAALVLGPVEACISRGYVCANCFRASSSSHQLKLLQCAACSAVSYCSKACQKAHWKRGGHKSACGLISSGGVHVSWCPETRENYASREFAERMGYLLELKAVRQYVQAHPFPKYFELRPKHEENACRAASLGRQPLAEYTYPVHDCCRILYESCGKGGEFDHMAKVVGERLNAIGGIPAMQTGYYMLLNYAFERLRMPSGTPGHGYTSVLEGLWDEIGEWRA